MSCMGWDVLATDLPDVISSVLARNVAQNASLLPADSGVIDVRVLDWTVPPDQWDWHHPVAIARNSNTPIPGQIQIQQASSSSSSSSPSSLLSPAHEHDRPQQHPPPADGFLGPPFDLIISSDTLYSPEITHPLLRTLHALSSCSISATGTSSSPRSPPVYLCIERRDPVLIDRALAEARETFDFVAERVPHRKLAKALERGGAVWDKSDWEGIELWKLTLHPNSK